MNAYQTHQICTILKTISNQLQNFPSELGHTPQAQVQGYSFTPNQIEIRWSFKLYLLSYRQHSFDKFIRNEQHLIRGNSFWSWGIHLKNQQPLNLPYKLHIVHLHGVSDFSLYAFYVQCYFKWVQSLYLKFISYFVINCSKIKPINSIHNRSMEMPLKSLNNLNKKNTFPLKKDFNRWIQFNLIKFLWNFDGSNCWRYLL